MTHAGPPAAPSPDMLPKLYAAGDHSILINRLDEAAWCFERAALLDPHAPRPLKGLAKTRHLQGRSTEARTLMNAAIARGEDTADSYTVLGQICQAEGDFEAARQAFTQALAQDPAHGPAYLRLAQLGPSADTLPRITQIEAARRRPGLSTDQQATLAFALAREYENSGRYDEAFGVYAQANAIRHAQYPGYSDSFSTATKAGGGFDAGFWNARRTFGNPSERPVFIVGMMRSGTTLVEQILASHPHVHGHGELSDIRQAARTIAAELGTAPTASHPAASAPYPGCLARLDAATASRHAAAYLARRVQQAPDALRSIDKLPHNFEHLGLIALLFANARIIHCTRDPIDTCLANYVQDFGPLNPFTYSLPGLGDYYRQYRSLMQHWTAVLPLRVLTVRYESLVADQEGWSRRMVAFLDLDWHPACLRFFENPRIVQTKSLWQVRQPVFTSSIGRWRHYRRHLGPLFTALGLPPDGPNHPTSSL